ncbi:hypothetical protein MKX01_018648, partial [Papaver californicum]
MNLAIICGFCRNMDDDPQPPATKKSRGVAKLNFLTKVEKYEQVAMEFFQREPVGPNTSKISAYCGELAQNGENFPFDIHDWSEMPDKEEKIEETIAELKNVFDYSDEINVWVAKKIHEKWKANKRKMKVHYYNEEKTEAQNRASCPKEVIDIKWENMCKHWRSPEFKSENGKESRKHLVMPHHAGTKSFVNHAVEIETTTQKKVNRAAEIRFLHNDLTEMKKANEESQKKIDALFLLLTSG